jgi:hypothetical protein
VDLADRIAALPKTFPAAAAFSPINRTVPPSPSPPTSPRAMDDLPRPIALISSSPPAAQCRSASPSWKSAGGTVYFPTPNTTPPSHLGRNLQNALRPDRRPRQTGANMNNRERNGPSRWQVPAQSEENE